MATTNIKQTPEHLYASALELVEQSQPEEALRRAKQLWKQVQHGSTHEALPALTLLGEISVELGAVDSAQGYFEEAVRRDPDGAVAEAAGGGAEKFLWLAQLCEEGGKQSVDWFEKGVKALKGEIAALESQQNAGPDEEALLIMRVEKKRKLANALCGIVEVYMTDLSWEDDAETRCESLITEAMVVEDETSPEVLQTLASVRLSQQRKEDARSALQRSLDLWIDLEPEDPAVPDFPTQISLARLLMEAEMEREAMAVLDRLIQEDDQSVEAWYLGGWCQYLIGERNKARSNARDGSGLETTANGSTVTHTASKTTDFAWKGSRRWLKTALRLYALLEYEDERLFAHAKELVEGLDTVLGIEKDENAGGEHEDWDDEWEGIGDGVGDEQDMDDDGNEAEGDDGDDEMHDV